MNNFTESTTYGSTSGGVADMTTQATEADPEGGKGPILWGKVALSLVIFLIGTVGNLLSLFVIIILKEYKKSVLHMYVFQLTVADLLFLLTLPFKMTEDIHREWPFADWLCAAKETMLFLNYNASVLFLMVMSIDRYIAVCHSFSPVLTKLREPLAAGCIICLVWLISILSCLPVIHNTHKAGTEPTCICQFRFRHTLSDKIWDNCRGEPTGTEDYKNCSLNVEEFYTPSPFCINPIESGDSGDYSGDSGDYSGEYEYLVEEDNEDIIEEECHYFGSPQRWGIFLRTNFVVLYIIPILVMAVTYGCIIYKVKNTNMPKATTTSFTNSDNLKKKKSNKLSIRNRVTIMSATLVSSFIICWLPFHAYHLAKIDGIRVPKGKGYICENVFIFASQMAYINSVINPYLYSFLGTDFGKRWRNVQSTVRKSVGKRTGQDVSRKTTKLQSVDSISQTKATNISRDKISTMRSSEGEMLA